MLHPRHYLLYNYTSPNKWLDVIEGITVTDMRTALDCIDMCYLNIELSHMVA